MSFDLSISLRKLNLSATEQDTTHGLPSPSESDSYTKEPFPVYGAARRPNHTVIYQYPDLSLLPQGEELYLQSPASACFRQRPGSSELSVNLDAINFFPICPVCRDEVSSSESSSTSSAAFPLSLEDRMANGLISAMERLPFAPGETKLSLVIYESKDEVRFRIMRKTTFGDGSKKEELYHFTQEGWDLLGHPLSFEDSERVWLKILDNLYLRASDLAYLHVQSQLKAQAAKELADEEEDSISWSNKSNWTVADVFLGHLSYKREGADGVEKRVRLRKRYLAELQKEITLRLPCKHYQLIKSKELATLETQPADDLFSAKCANCGLPILTERDKVDLEVISDGKMRKEREAEDDWQDLDKPITEEDEKVITAESIANSLEIARGSFTVPSSIVPMVLSPEFFEETRMVSDGLQAELAGHHHLPASPIGLHKKLLAFAETLLLSGAREHGYVGDAAGLPTPLGWLWFAERWFTRTVNFLFTRECDGTHQERRGMHWHGEKTPSSGRSTRPRTSLRRNGRASRTMRSLMRRAIVCCVMRQLQSLIVGASSGAAGWKW